MSPGASGLGKERYGGVARLAGVPLDFLWHSDKERARGARFDTSAKAGRGRGMFMTRHTTPPSRLVYSTDQGRICPGCGRPVAHCACARKKDAPKGDGIVRVSRQTKGRKGKGVSLVTGLSLPPEALEALAKTLKQRCGAGGAVKDGVIEIQGDHRETLARLLRELGHTVKLAGG